MKKRNVLIVSALSLMLLSGCSNGGVSAQDLTGGLDETISSTVSETYSETYSQIEQSATESASTVKKIATEAGNSAIESGKAIAQETGNAAKEAGTNYVNNVKSIWEKIEESWGNVKNIAITPTSEYNSGKSENSETTTTNEYVVAENTQNATSTDSETENATVAQDDNENEFICAYVSHVRDGDTIVVNTESGEELVVRLIGVNTPESVSSDESENCEEGEIASDFTKSYLSEGTTVYLEYDEEKTDVYGRTLAYVWMRDDVDTTDFNDFCEYNYGAILLQNTYCESVYYAPNGKYRAWYDQLDATYTDYEW